MRGSEMLAAVLIFACVATVAADVGCPCEAVAKVGHRDATCSCAASPAAVDRYLSEFVELDSGIISRQNVSFVECSATCDSTNAANKGLYITECSCKAAVVGCPAHTHGHPDCMPDDGYFGTVTWNGDKMAYEADVTAKECPSSAKATTDGGCACGAYDKNTKLAWNAEAADYSPKKCEPVPCPSKANYIEIKSGEDAVCVCDDGYRQEPKGTRRAVPFNAVGRKWESTCVWANCPAHSHAVGGTCVCDGGYVGDVTWNDEEGEWKSTCKLATCPVFAEHEPLVEGDDFRDCVCSPGYFAKDGLQFTNGEWAGTCEKVACATDGSNVDGEVPCKCSNGYLDVESGSELPVLGEDGSYSQCVEVGCNFVGSIYSDDGCGCEDGRVRSVNANGDEWSLACSGLKPCPEGATATSSGGKNECICDKIGFSGESLWNGNEWSACTTVSCPNGTVADASGSGCVCDDGCIGLVTWDEEASAFSNNCDCNAPIKANTESDGEGGMRCTKGYAGTVKWAGGATWESTCTKRECPDGSQGFPNCACSPGYVGGSSYKGMGLFWNYEGATSEWSGCNKTLAGPCVGVCHKVACPNFAEEGGDSGCQCKHGYNGVLAFVDRRSLPPVDGFMGVGGDTTGQGFKGSCQLAACPPEAEASFDNSSGISVATCSCRKGFVPEEGGLEWSRPLQKWLGKCVMATCPGDATINHPDYECARGALPGDGKTNVEFVEGEGYVGCCDKEECPKGADQSTWPWCTCLPRYQAKVNGSNSYSPAHWWVPEQGGYQHTCELVECPEGGGIAPNCNCELGYSGTTRFEGNSWTPCVKEICPANSEISSDTGLCKCQLGYAGDISWNAATQKWDGECEKKECPAALICNEDGTATCSKGFTGEVSFVNGDWSYDCVAVNCPDHSSGHPDCRADQGYKGSTAESPMLTWSGTSWEGPTYVGCPSYSTRTQSDACVCNAGYQGNPTFNYASGTYATSNQGLPCVPAKCPDHASASLEGDRCNCEAGYSPSSDFGWRDGAFRGSCTKITCDNIPNAEMDAGVCKCKAGYVGQLTLADNRYQGQCVKADCPLNAVGDECACLAGYKTVGDASWNGNSWSHQCAQQDCDSGVIGGPLASGAYYCKCPQGFKGSVSWGGDNWIFDCESVGCPENSHSTSDKTCGCYDGYMGTIEWDPVSQSFVGECRAEECPSDFAVFDAETKMCKCAENRGMEGEDCTWSATDGWRCACKPRECGEDKTAAPANTVVDAGECRCAKGFKSDTNDLLVSAYYKDEIGTCVTLSCPSSCSVEKKCSDVQVDGESVAEGTTGSCTCKRGFKGTVTWSIEDGDYDSKCAMEECPAGATKDTWPFCNCPDGFLASNGISTSGASVSWDFEAGEWSATCTAASCDPESSTGAVPGEAEGQCACPAGYTDAFQPVVFQGDGFKGQCSATPCPTGMGSAPECACDAGFQVLRNSLQQPVGCTAAVCPDNAEGAGACECKEGFIGSPEWDAVEERWTHTCGEESCPLNAERHPHCKCSAGYGGSIVWNKDTNKFEGNCTFEECPAHSIRETIVTEEGGISTVVVRCKCHVGRAGGYEWNDAGFFSGSCGDFQECPEGASCQSLADTPTLSLTTYPALPGWTGAAVWSTDASAGTWKSNIRKVDCPAGTTGHPNCVCSPGKHGGVNFDGVNFVSTCQDAPCPDLNMARADGSTCRCPVGMAGVATWDNATLSFTGAQECEEVMCPGGMKKSSSPAMCVCGEGFSGAAIFDNSKQDYLPTGPCAPQRCPDHADCSSLPAKCMENRKGAIKWNEAAQKYDTSCALASCPPNSKRGTSGSCVCLGGFNPPASYDSETEQFVGCSKESEALPNTVWSPSKGAFTCKAGMIGEVKFDVTFGELVSTCEEVSCDAKTQVRSADGVCKCAPGYTGAIQWVDETKEYTGDCTIAPCDSDAGIDCSALDGDVAPPAVLPCKRGYAGKATWTGEVWESTCEFGGCVPNAAFDESREECVCKWGYVGVAGFVTEGQVGAGCILADCPLGTNKASDGRGCQCPRAAFEGSCTFSAGRGWMCECGAAVSCPPGAKNIGSEGNIECVCDKGYAGTVKAGVSIAVEKPDLFNAVVHTSSLVHSSCVKEVCPVNSVGHPDCACKPGFAGSVKFIEATRKYDSTCKVAQCNVPHTSGKPDCHCEPGYVSSEANPLTWSTIDNIWTGSCTAAPCPENADGPHCDCKPGYYVNKKKWNVTSGWMHVCEEHYPDVNARKVAGGAAAQCNPGYKRDGGKNLVWNAKSGQYTGSCVEADCAANAECDPPSEVRCNNGFNMTESFVWDYAAEKWNGKCSPVPCPNDAKTLSGTESSASECSCRDGFSGSVEWGEGEWVVDCKPEPCSAFATRQEDGSCMCDAGYVRDDKKNLPIVFEGKWLNRCVEVPCPASSVRVSDGQCACNTGYNGMITFANGKYVGKCEAAPCPDNSTSLASGKSGSAIGCVCDPGFEGAVWNDAVDAWSRCEPIQCPENAERYPSENPSFMCQCSKGYGGSIQWDGHKFTGKCTELDTEPVYAVVPVESVAGVVCKSVDGVTQSTGTFSTQHNGVLLDFVKETTLRCDIAVSPRDFSRVRGKFTVKVLTQGVKVAMSKAVTEWHNILTDVNPGERTIALGTPYNIISPGEEGFDFKTAPTATFSLVETSVTPTKILRVEVHQGMGAQLVLDFSEVETLNSVSEYIVMSTTVSSLPSRQ